MYCGETVRRKELAMLPLDRAITTT